MPKITLPNGVIIEVDKVTYDADGNMTMMDIKTEDTRVVKPIEENEIEEDLCDAVNGLTDTQRHTYRVLCKMGPSHVGSIAEKLGITNAATTQRMTELIKAELVERLNKGHYRAVK